MVKHNFKIGRIYSINGYKAKCIPMNQEIGFVLQRGGRYNDDQYPILLNEILTNKDRYTIRDISNIKAQQKKEKDSIQEQNNRERQQNNRAKRDNKRSTLTNEVLDIIGVIV